MSGNVPVNKIIKLLSGEGATDLGKVRFLVFSLSVFFVITLAVLFYGSLHNVLQLKKEIRGTQVISDLAGMVKSLQDMRGLAQIEFYGDQSVSQEIKNLDQNFDRQIENFLSQSADDPFGINEKVQGISQSMNSHASHAHFKGFELFREFSKVIETLFVLIQRVHNDSGLVLDSEYSSYYLEQVASFSLVRVSENLGRIRGMTSGLIQQRNKNSVYIEEIKKEMILLQENSRRLKDVLGYLSQEKDFQECVCHDGFQGFFSRIDKYVQFTGDVVRQPAFSKSPGGYFRDSTLVLDEAELLRTQVSKRLIDVLKQRYFKEVWLSGGALVVSLLILAVFLWLFRFYYFSNVKLNRLNQSITEGRRILLRSASLDSEKEYENVATEVYRSLCQNLVEHTGYKLVWIGLKDENEAKVLTKTAYAGEASGYLAKIKVSWGSDELGKGPAGMAVKSGENQIYNNIETAPGFAPWREAAMDYGIYSVASIPMVQKGEVIGVLVLYSPHRNAFRNQELDLLRELTTDVMFNLSVIETRRQRDTALAELEKSNDQLQEKVILRTQQIAQVQEATVIGLSTLVEFRDHETGNHILRTREYIKILLEEMTHHEVFQKELTSEKIEFIYKSAPLHDIGKVGIPDQILNKPGKLTPEESAIMKTHTTIGAEAIEMTTRGISEKGFLVIAEEIILHHHEKWNGEGYPYGLKGKEIPLSARVMTVADVYDALISKRVYKEAYSHEEAVEIMKEESGALFDPRIIEIFLSISDQFHKVALRLRDE